MPDAAIPKRKFGKADAMVSCIGVGGHHIGDAPDVNTAVKLIQRAARLAQVRRAIALRCFAV